MNKCEFAKKTFSIKRIVFSYRKGVYMSKEKQKLNLGNVFESTMKITSNITNKTKSLVDTTKK